MVEPAEQIVSHWSQAAAGKPFGAATRVLSSVCKPPPKFIALHKSLNPRKRPLLSKERKWWGKE